MDPIDLQPGVKFRGFVKVLSDSLHFSLLQTVGLSLTSEGVAYSQKMVNEV